MAAIAVNIETIEYRVIVARRDSLTVLALNSIEGYHLPCVLQFTMGPGRLHA
jgi:hypothetical protein